jgi:WD domain, G-beta repeat
LGKVLEGHDGGVLALTCVENAVWSGAADKTIRVWDAQVRKKKKKKKSHLKNFFLILLLLQTGWALRDIRGHTGWVTSFATRGAFVWSGSGDKTIRVWNSRVCEDWRIGGLNGWRIEWRMEEWRNGGMEEWRNRGIEESRNRGIEESRIEESRIEEYRNRGIEKR